MIFVDRDNVAAPKVLTDNEGAGLRETARAIKFYAVKENFDKGKSFKFTVYRNKSVKKALKKLFKAKCAYCESKMKAVMTADVEHFRPKGGFGPDNALIKPGYYWLAADWNNLLPSCISCNRKNTFEIVGNGEKTVGKVNQFPLSSELFRLRRPSDDFSLEEAERLLLNPCLDRPENHLRFSDDGLVRAKLIDNQTSVKGLKSIEVYALLRKDLVEEREQRAIEIKSQMASVMRWVKMQDRLGASDADVKESLDFEVAQLTSFLHPNRDYLALARELITPFMKDNFGVDI